MSQHLQILINGQQTFFLSQRILSKYSLKLKNTIKQEKRTTQLRNSALEIDDFPGGPDGFELVARFCYNDGAIAITVANVSLLHCAAVFLEMTEKSSPVNLLHQTEVFLDGIFYWSWREILTCLKNCEPFFSIAHSCGLIGKLISSLIAKISQNSDVGFLSVSSSPETMSRSLSFNSSSSSRKNWRWWFEDMTILSPKIIEQFLRQLGFYGAENSNSVLTRFLLHYLKTVIHGGRKLLSPAEYRCLSDTAVYGVVSTARNGGKFSVRGLFWVLRIVSRFAARERKAAMERMIGEMLDTAVLDDLLVCGGGGERGVYDVSFVLRLIRYFVRCNGDEGFLDKMRKVGGLIDKYLKEIGPDPNLKISKFVGVAESLPDSARDSYDGVYRAVDIYLQSHPALSLEKRSRLCRCLNFKKLSLETCKDLAKNQRIPPRIAVKAMISQPSATAHTAAFEAGDTDSTLAIRSNKKRTTTNKDYQLVLYRNNDSGGSYKSSETESSPEEIKVERMRRKVMELERVCREMKGQMGGYNMPVPRYC